jgi:hypothetical protein
MMLNQRLKQALIYFSILVSVLVYWLFAYQLDRSNFKLLMTLFTLSFLAYVLIYKFKSTINLPWLIAISIVFRLLFLFSIPALSDDFYRFIWDGQLLVNGINPYSILPIDVQEYFPNKDLLLAQMNSPSYYSVYPPLNQLFFAIPALLSPQSILGSVVVLRLFILLAEVGTLLILPKFLKALNISPHKSLLYALNPLVIVELSGNLHFEALWVFGLLLSVYFLHRKRLLLSSLLWAAVASIKLIPLLLLPALIRRLKVKNWLNFMVGTILIFGLGFLFFYDQHLLTHYTTSLKLYASTFEFNSGIYYVIRSIGYYFVDYNPIKTIGPVFSAIGLLGLLFLLVRKPLKSTQALFVPMLFGLSWYYFFALVVHPWYVVPLVFMSVFTNYRFAILWSFLITTSYYAYSQPEFLESHWLIALEYGVVMGYFMVECFNYSKIEPLTH